MNDYILLGKPNVGKTSIFNILVGQKKNIVHKDINTTKNWHKDSIKNSNNYIYDTPGVIISKKEKFNINNLSIIKNLIKKIEFILYVIDFKEGFNLIDLENINYLRKQNKEIVLLINKSDNDKNNDLDIFKKYGLKKFFFLSCSHNIGFEKLFKELNFYNKKLINGKFNHDDFSIAIFGKPNTGKSTFLNTLLGYQRSLVSEISGTTSDYVTDYIIYNNSKLKIIDTAGIGKKSNIKFKSINYLSIKKTLENIKLNDVSLIMIDAKENLNRQDKRIINMISNKSKSIILIFNKFDLIKAKSKYKIDTNFIIKNTLNDVKNIEIFYISSLLKKDVNKVINYIYKNIINKNNKISTSKINSWLNNIVKKYQHPLIENKKVNFKYAVQVNDKPITIKIFCNYSNKLKQNYKKFLVNEFNNHFNIINQKTRFIFSSSKNPYI